MCDETRCTLARHAAQHGDLAPGGGAQPRDAAGAGAPHGRNVTHAFTPRCAARFGAADAGLADEADCSTAGAAQVAPALSWGVARSFAAGHFLDKAQVTERVITVVKNFSKVDPSKARTRAPTAAPLFFIVQKHGSSLAARTARAAAASRTRARPPQVTPKAAFQSELGLDSLDTVEVVMAFEEEFSIEIPDSEADKILSVSDAIEYLSSHPSAK